MASRPITSWQIEGAQVETGIFYFLRLHNHFWWWLQPVNENTLVPWNENYDKPRQCVKKQRHHFADKGPYSQSYGFSSSHVWIWDLDHKKHWALKNWCFRTMVLEKALEHLLDSKIQPVNPKGNQPWILIGRIDADAEFQMLWPPDAKNQLTGKDLNSRKDWRKKDKGVIENNA